MAKKEFTVHFYKDANDAWCGAAFFINDTLGKKHVVTVAAGPREKKTTSVSWIKQRLTEYEEEMRGRHYDWYRVEETEYDNFNTKN